MRPPTIFRSLAKRAVLAVGLLAATLSAAAAVRGRDDPLGPWRSDVTIRLVAEVPGRHTIHAYYLTNPESPDGTRVVFFASTTPEGHHGDLIVRDRASGRETVVARDVDTEDAHRAACQQWTSAGKRVAYHDVKDSRWSVHVVDLDTLRNRKLIDDRQLCFGRAVDDVLPIYGCHWNPGAHRNLEFLDAATGNVRTVVTIAEVEKRYDEWLKKEFGGRTTSIFFPHISPDGLRVFFKMSAPGRDGLNNNYMSRNASHRQGTVVFDLKSRQLVFMREQWGHPAWYPDSRRIIEIGNVYFNVDGDGRPNTIPEVPRMSGCHPSVSPDGRLFVMDGRIDKIGGAPGEWGIVVCDVRGKHFKLLHRFDNSRGAKSWRKNHPHPIFSADGRRIYFNVNEGEWTQLMVAESVAGP